MTQADMKMYEDLVESDAAQALMDFEVKWPPLPGKAALPDFPVHVLPEVFRNFTIASTESIQNPMDANGCVVIGAVSVASLGTYISVLPGYSEPMQTYIVIALPPSERKTPSFRNAMQAQRDMVKIINTSVEGEKKTTELKRKMLEARLAKAIKINDEDTAKELQAEMDQLPIIKSYSQSLTDSTPEALAKAMSDNGGMISYVSAEGNLFNIASGSYSDNPNIDVLLQGYSGEPVYIERIGRAPVIIDNATLSILLAVQPQVLDRFLSNEVLLERGLCARFLYSVPHSMLGRRNARKIKAIPASVASRYSGIIHALVKQSYDGINRELTLTPIALEFYFQWAEEVEKNIGPGGPWHGIACGWEGKLVGNTIRLAGIVKLMDSPDYSLPITEVHFSAAVELARYFVAHALAITGKATGLTPASKEVLDEIKKQGQSPFSPYDLRQKLRFRKNFKEGAKVDEALACLAESGYIRLSAPPEWRGTGRKPEALYEMHPDLLPKN